MSRLSPLKAVTFDLDGLMFNTEELLRRGDARAVRPPAAYFHR